MNLDELRSEIDMRRDLEFKYCMYAIVAMVATLLWGLSAVFWIPSGVDCSDTYVSMFVIVFLLGVFTTICLFTMETIEEYRWKTLYHVYFREKYKEQFSKGI